MKTLMKSCFALLVAAVSLPSVAQQGGLKEIMQAAMKGDPLIQEAKANIDIANTQVKISQAGHWPVVGVATKQKMASRYNDHYTRSNTSHNTLQASVNLYSWGEISNSVERDKQGQRYAEHKYDETREQLGREVGQIYLNALRAKEYIAVYQESMQSYAKILNELKVIASHDPGRESETVEAESRYLQAQSNLVGQQRILETSLSQLSRYTGYQLNPAQLSDPFANITPEILKAKYTSTLEQQNPSYLAQQAEMQRAQAQQKASKAKRLPSINLVAETDRHGGYEASVNVSWNFFDPATYYSGVQDLYSVEAAKAKMSEIGRSMQENSQTAEISMQQSLNYLKVSAQQIQSQRNVVVIYQDQYQISRRSLIDVLDAHQTLSNVQISQAAAKGDYREAVLAYLVAQAQLSNWAGVVSLKGL
ncbi:TolC family protein [Lonepinella koalarum]|uniref:TolC family protein n=1 Tax=Lonepinella koalarum TaxID=53417 RepID=UPI003F6DAF60